MFNSVSNMLVNFKSTTFDINQSTMRHGCMQFMFTFTRGRQEPNFYIDGIILLYCQRCLSYNLTTPSRPNCRRPTQSCSNCWRPTQLYKRLHWDDSNATTANVDCVPLSFFQPLFGSIQLSMLLSIASPYNSEGGEGWG